jgi:hypothetical protein
MPKPVEKTGKLPVPKKAKRPSSDPNKRVHQMMAELQARTDATVTPPQGDPIFEAQFRARMKALGSKGGKQSGIARMEKLTPNERREIAAKAARDRWASERKKKR